MWILSRVVTKKCKNVFYDTINISKSFNEKVITMLIFSRDLTKAVMKSEYLAKF